MDGWMDEKAQHRRLRRFGAVASRN